MAKFSSANEDFPTDNMSETDIVSNDKIPSEEKIRMLASMVSIYRVS
jgi:hypothetical protein